MSDGGDTLVLCYHGIGEDPGELSIGVRSFARQVASLLARGFMAVRASDLAQTSPRPRLAVTFDDGERSVLQTAAPVLESLGVVATVFVITDCVGREVRRGSDVSPALSWDELRQLSASGWEIGSHTTSHARLPALGDADVAAQLTASKSRIESEIKSSCASLAYPYGLATDREERIARDAGYAVAFTASRRFASPALHRLPRVVVFRSDGRAMFRLKTSPITRRARSTAMGSGLAAAVNYARGGVSVR